MRLNKESLAELSADVSRFQYDRDTQHVGIVHMGIGAFHRGHLAWYTEQAMNSGDRNWAITGVSLRSRDVADQLNPQDGLYTVSERSHNGTTTQLVGAVKGVLVAAHDRAAIIAAIAAPATQIISLTVTEKGYCRTPDGSLDRDLAGPASFYAFIAAALRQRHDNGRSGITLLSCDNLADNGRQLAMLMEDYLDRYDPALLAWFRSGCTCPSTMVDRIVPATTEADRMELSVRIGFDDYGAVMTEPFSQWVIENNFAVERPRWESVGAELVEDVRPYEMAKLRMLNGAHSLLAYCGLARGYVFVHEAIRDPELLSMTKRLMLEEAAPTIKSAKGQNLSQYANDLIERFGNPALNHRLIQIAMDGSQKLPQRWLETMAERQKNGLDSPIIATGLSAWIHHIGVANGSIDDPLAEELSQAVANADPFAALFGENGIIGHYPNLL